MPQLLRVGFLSTSNIGLKNASAAQLSGCIDLVAVASRNLASAQSYATENGFRKAYASYQELLDDEEVEAVYIPLPTTMHLEWVLKAAHAGKHVLCDKPVGVGLAQLVEMLKAVDGKNLVFMDGVMFMHHPRLPLLLKTLKDRDLFPEGPVSRVVTAFTFPGGGEFFKDNIRIKKELEPYGCVGDLGWYNVRLSLLAFDWTLPTHVRCEPLSSTPEGVPISVTFSLYFPNGNLATGDCGFDNAFRQWAEFSSPPSRVYLDDFVHPSSNYGCGFTVHAHTATPAMQRFVGERTVQVKVDTVKELPQDAAMWKRFADEVARKKDGGRGGEVWKEGRKWAVLTQVVCDAMMESVAKGGEKVEVPPLTEEVKSLIGL